MTHDAWHIGMPGEQIPHGLIIKNVRVAILLIRGVTEETLLLRASALAFATILFLVPFLAFVFSFIQTFNLGDQVYSQLSATLNSRLTQFVALINRAAPAQAPSAAQDAEAPPQAPARENNNKLWGDLIETLFPGWHELHAATGVDSDPVHIVVQIAEKGATNPKALSIAGIFYVLTTVLGMMRNVELALNGIWGVKPRRNLLRTVSDYLVITMLLPFVMAFVLGITAALAATRDTAPLVAFALHGGQLAIICMTFALVYYLVPNTRVQFKNALLGGFVASILWTGLSYSYVTFQIGLARYALFFSTFALFPLLLMWMYLSWLVFLFGALVSFAYQNEKTFAMERLAEKATFAYRESLALRLFLEMTGRFKHGGPALCVADIAEAWNVPTRLLNETLDELGDANLVTACATEPITYQPARSPNAIRVADVLNALRKHGEDPSLFREDPAFRELYTAMDEGRAELLQANIDALADRYSLPTTPTRARITPFSAKREAR